VTGTIIFNTTLGQLDGALGAFDVELSDETLTKLDELFPPVGRGGPGPEAWAW
jgi:NDP-hexose 2,3-enoyl reductase